MATPTKDLTKLLKAAGLRVTADPKTLALIGEILVSSAQRSIQVGGRYKAAGSFQGGPNKWAPLRPLSAGFKKERGKSPTNLLQDTGRLRTSINYQVQGNKLLVGSNAVYAAIHQFGGRIRVTPKSRAFFRYKLATAKKPAERKFWAGLASNRSGFVMPARPFITIQPEDIEDIGEIVAERMAQLSI